MSSRVVPGQSRGREDDVSLLIGKIRPWTTICCTDRLGYTIHRVEDREFFRVKVEVGEDNVSSIMERTRLWKTLLLPLHTGKRVS